MFKRIAVGAVAAGVISAPLAATAYADPPADAGSGVGPGGIPAVIGNNLGSDGPVAPGSVIKTYAQQPGTSTPDAIHNEFPGTDRTPGGAIKRQTPGSGHGNGPPGTEF